MIKLDLRNFCIKRKKRVQLLAKGNIRCRIDDKRKKFQIFFKLVSKSQNNCEKNYRLVSDQFNYYRLCC